MKKILLLGTIFVLTSLWWTSSAVTPESCFSGAVLADGTIEITAYDHLSCGQSVDIPEIFSGKSVTQIGQDAFANKNLTGIILPDSLVKIGNQAFATNYLTGVILPNSLTKIAASAFSTNHLTEVVFPTSLLEIGDDAFAYNNLTGIVLPNLLTKIGEWAFFWNHLKEIVLPNSLLEIGRQVFENNHLTSIVFPNWLTKIKDQAFANNQLTSVVFPDSLEYIGPNAFDSNPWIPEYSSFVEGLVTKDLASITLDGGASWVNVHLVRLHKLSFDTDGGTAVASGVYRSWATVLAPESPIKTWFTFSGWNQIFPLLMPDSDLVVKALWRNITLTFDLDGGTGLETITGVYNTPLIVSDPTKTGFTFIWWSPSLPATITVDQTFKALWKANSTSSYSGGGGSSLRSSSNRTDTHKPEDHTSEILTDDQKADPRLSELTQAYNRAFERGITTISGEENARLTGAITRAELAKMMSVYAVEVLGRSPILTWNANYRDVDSRLGDLENAIQLAYQLQIMGIEADGSPLIEFNPNGLITRAEFATVFSRVLRWAKHNQDGNERYAKHLLSLKDAGILKDTTPTMKELRGWVMLMLMRSEKVE